MLDEKLSEFSFNVQYIPGVENVLLDKLSCLYDFNTPRTVHTPREYLQHDPHVDIGDNQNLSNVLSAPLYVGLKAMAQMDDNSDTAAEQCDRGLSTLEPQSEGPADGQPYPGLVGQDGECFAQHSQSCQPEMYSSITSEGPLVVSLDRGPQTTQPAKSDGELT